MAAKWMWTSFQHPNSTQTRPRFLQPIASNTRRTWLTSSALILLFAIFFLLFHVSPVARITGWESAPPLPTTTPDPTIYKNEPDRPGFFEWVTKSEFFPARIEDAQDKSIQDLCASFPTRLLGEIQPVLKTGHGVLDDRVRPQLQGASACLDNLLIFSDVDEVFEGRQIIDILKDIPRDLASKADDLEAWRNGSIADGTASTKAGWRADRFKFISSATRAWMQRPGRKWYVFFEADTYIVWDNVFRLLANFDPNEPYYFGSPTPGRDSRPGLRTWFANGGPGFILSREALRRLTEDDFNHTTGHYIGPNTLRQFWDVLDDDCCGDSVLGWALWHHNVSLSGLWPMMNPHPPHGVPFADQYWCQPLMTMHKPAEEDLMGLWRWQFQERVSDRPLTYRDLATTYFNLSSLEPREDWNNAGWDGFKPPVPSEAYDYDPHKSFDACGDACKAHGECFQWTYHLKQCHFVRSFRYGKHEAPGLGAAREKSHPNENEKDWDADALRWMSGWDTKKIAKWVSERPCNEVKWPRPSTKRIF